MKKKIISGFFFVIFLINISQPALAEEDFKIGDTVKCNVEVLNIRSEPSIKVNRVGKLKKDDIAIIKDGPVKKDGYTWYQINNQSNSGWVASKYLTLDIKKAKIKTYAFVDVDTKLMFRSKPSIKGRILSRLKNGTRVEVLDERVLSETHNWIKVKVKERIGYVSKHFLRFEDKLSQRNKRSEKQSTNMVKIKDIQLKLDKNTLETINILTSKSVDYKKYVLGQAQSKTKRIVLDFKKSEIEDNIIKKLKNYSYDKIWIGSLKGKEDVVRLVVTIRGNKKFNITDLDSKYGLQINFIKNKRETIIIDAGHGGLNTKSYNGHIGDSGTISPYTNKMEKDLVLSVSFKLKKSLENRGYNVVMTRTKDEYIDLYKRADIANNTNGDAFLSIHFNSSKNSSATGIETLYCPSNKKNEIKPKDQISFARVMQDTLSNKLNRRNRRLLKKPQYVILRETKMPAVLMELGFLTNKEDERLARNKTYQKRAAEAIADGLDKYFSK